MAKSNYLPGLLWLALVFFHPFSAGIDVNYDAGSRIGSDQSKRDDKVRQVRAVYLSQLGVREKGTNSGAEVERYLKYASLGKGQPWCAAFVCWVLGQANVENPRTGWSPSLFSAKRLIWKRETSLKRTRAESKEIMPGPGDVFGIYFSNLKRIAHAGFVDRWDDNWVVTVEGNTNDSGSREGDGVYRKRRLTRSLYRVARYIN